MASLHELFVLLVEECSEVIKCVTKLMRVGASPEKLKRDLQEEIADIEIIIKILEEHHYLDRLYIDRYKARKRAIRG